MSRPSTRTSAPKHRAETTSRRASHAPAGSTPKHAAERPQRELALNLRRSVVVPATVVVTLGAAAVAGVTSFGQQDGPTAALLAEVNGDATPGAADSDVLEALRTQRGPSTSRSDRRTEVDSVKLQALSQEAESGDAVTRTEDLGGGDPRQIAQALLPEFGFSSDQFSCLDALWTKESGWNVYADNPTSSAYGIPQALPGEKMASAGADWATNPATQIRWGLGYIADRYGSPCSAWGHSQANNWY